MGDFLSVKHGYPFQSEHFATEGHYVVVTPGNFYEAGGFKRIPGKEKYFTAQFPAEYLLKKGDLVVAMTQQTAGLLGSTAIIPADDEYLHNQRIGLISFDETVVDKLYLYYLFMSRSVRKQIEDSASGTKIKHTSPDKIYDVIVYLPDIVVQKSVGKLLWALEQKITNNACIATELESMAKMLYDYWFGQFDFPDANGKPYRASGGEMVWNEQLKREIPKGWGAGCLSEVANIVMGQSPDGASYNEDGMGMIFYQGRTDFGTRFPTPRVYTTAPTRFAKEGDILLSVRAPVGDLNIAMEDCCIGRGLAALNSKLGSQLHLLYTLSGFKQIFDVMDGNGTTFGSITKDTLFEMKVVIPHSELLKAFEEAVSPIEQKIRACEIESRELSELRDWLLPMLMNGQAMVAPAETAPKLQVLQPEKPARDPRFDRWLQTQGVAARGTVDEQTLHDIFDAMDDDDKQ